MFDDLYTAVDIFHENSSKTDNEIIRLLEQEFASKGRGYFHFLPMAFARIVLSRLGVKTFPDMIGVQKSNGDLREVLAINQDIYMRSLDMGEAEISTEFTNKIEQAAFQNVMYRGSEGQIVSQLIQSNQRDVGGSISMPVIIDDKLIVTER